MKKIKAILVDDEIRARRVLSSLLERNCPEVELVSSCDNVLSAVAEIKKTKPDLVFLDIQMPEYNGYELMKFIPDINFQIIFVTAYDQYALKAFELCATDYLLKPVKRERLKEAVKKAAEKVQKEDAFENYKELANSLNEAKFSKIIIASHDGKRKVNFDDIIGISGEGAYSVINLQDGEQIMASKNLKYFQEALDVDKRFFRCHKSWIVNLNKVKKTKSSNLIIEMDNGLEIKISKSKRVELTQLLSF